MKPGSKILVIGATGLIGTAVIKALLADKKNQWKIHAMSRNPFDEKARSLKLIDPDRIRLVYGNTNDIASIKEAIADVQGIFCNTDYKTVGLDEHLQGKRIMEACRWSKIEHFVYLALDYVKEISKNAISAPRMDMKGEVEKAIAGRRVADSWYQTKSTVLTVVPLMERFLDQWKPVYEDGKYRLRLPLKDKSLPLIAVDDVAWFIAFIFANPTRFGGKTIKIAAETLTGNDIANRYKEITQQDTVYENVESLGDEEVDKEFEFIRDFGMTRNYEYVRKVKPNIKTFKQWLKDNV